MPFQQLSKIIEENATNGRYHCNQQRRVRKSTNFFINEESKDKRESLGRIKRKQHRKKIDKHVKDIDTNDDDESGNECNVSTRLNKKRRILTVTMARRRIGEEESN